MYLAATCTHYSLRADVSYFLGKRSVSKLNSCEITRTVSSKRSEGLRSIACEPKYVCVSSRSGKSSVSRDENFKPVFPS